MWSVYIYWHLVKCFPEPGCMHYRTSIDVNIWTYVRCLCYPFTLEQIKTNQTDRQIKMFSCWTSPPNALISYCTWVSQVCCWAVLSFPHQVKYLLGFCFFFLLGIFSQHLVEQTPFLEPGTHPPLLPQKWLKDKCSGEPLVSLLL